MIPLGLNNVRAHLPGNRHDMSDSFHFIPGAPTEIGGIKWNIGRLNAGSKVQVSGARTIETKKKRLKSGAIQPGQQLYQLGLNTTCHQGVGYIEDTDHYLLLQCPTSPYVVLRDTHLHRHETSR